MVNQYLLMNPCIHSILHPLMSIKGNIFFLGLFNVLSLNPSTQGLMHTVSRCVRIMPLYREGDGDPGRGPLEIYPKYHLTRSPILNTLHLTLSGKMTKELGQVQN